ncbi:thiamine phosphate synthase [uncultured Ferrimonas sp.]|uniref:thiamine phosphate synthase n=1 Tax=uncultured Ferrimonas sp. TaxID=432640 RepID=UPI0026338DC5|nr:thiamine phosphate synthase [uncultured Ferrimonas sp.]
MSGATRPIVWTIAGSDSGGGAGIQADLLTIHDLGGHGCSAITAVTAQNSVAVTHIAPLSASSLVAQLDALWADLPPQAIKIGLLADAAQIELLAVWLQARQSQLPPIILDPVLVASSGARLSAPSDSAVVTRFDPLLPLVTLITPNGDELAALTGVAIDSPQAVVHACEQLCGRGAKAVLAKGGHFDHFADACHQRQCVDLLYQGQQRQLFVGERINTHNTHGSGCTLAAALATTLALGYDLLDGVTVTRAYLHNGLQASCQLGQGPGPLARTGWPTQLASFPRIALASSELGRAYGMVAHLRHTAPKSAAAMQSTDKLPTYQFVGCGTKQLGVYPVVDSLAWVERLLALGVKTLQLRIKSRSPQQVEADIAAAIACGKRHHARLFINDYWQLAIKHGAYGVHLGQEDLADADLAAIQAAGLRLGLSTHGYYEIARAHSLGPSYIALGHVFATPTKQMASAPQGLTRLKRYAQLLQPHYPTVAIGGIDIRCAAAVAQCGVGSIAVVRAVTESADPQQALAQLAAALKQPLTQQSAVDHQAITLDAEGSANANPQ